MCLNLCLIWRPIITPTETIVHPLNNLSNFFPRCSYFMPQMYFHAIPLLRYMEYDLYGSLHCMAFMENISMVACCSSFSDSFSVSLYSCSFVTNYFSSKSTNSLPICCTFSFMRPTSSTFLYFSICTHM